MKNGITILIETRYGDLRASEKRAADYILAHMEKIRELSLEKLAKKKRGQPAYDCPPDKGPGI